MPLRREGYVIDAGPLVNPNLTLVGDGQGLSDMSALYNLELIL